MRKWLLCSMLCITSLLSYATPLPAAHVFQVEAKPVDPNTFMMSWQIKPGYFLYRDRIKLTTTTKTHTERAHLRFPGALKKTDSQGQTYEIYRHQLLLPVTILNQQPGEELLNIHFQGCADSGFCYPPETRQIKLTIDNNLALTAVTMEIPTESQTITPPPSNSIEAIFLNKHWAVVILSFFGFGLLLSFTPCVLPMIPVLSSLILGHSNTLSTRKAFLLSLSYVLSMSITYAMVGAMIALLGSNLQVAMQSPWAISVFSFIFVLLALSMFGFYDLRLPTAWQAKLAHISHSHSRGHYIGAAIMGCLSTLILSPCVTAPLIGALSYIAHSGNISLGTFALFFLSLGMGTPLLLIGASAGQWLPKTGPWMNKIKVFFGVLLLAIAVFLLERILPQVFVMILWACLFIFTGIYCGALTKALTKMDKFHQGLGLLLLIYGLLILIGASMGNTNPMQPLVHSSITTELSTNIRHKTVKTMSELQHVLSQAKGQPIMLDFYADWCTSCKVMERTTFKDPRIEKALERFVVVKVDITANKTQEKILLQQFKVVAPPTFLFFNGQGEEQVHLRVIGETSASQFLKQLQRVLGLDKLVSEEL